MITALHSPRRGISTPTLAAPAVVAAAFLFLLAAVSAPASLVAPMSVEDLAGVSEDIVQVRVEASQSEVHNGLIVTRHQARVVDSIKGRHQAGDPLELVTLGGSIGPVSSKAPGLPTLDEGEESILFLSRPFERLSRTNPAAAAGKNAESPLHQSPQIVGGFQGKFSVVRTGPYNAEATRRGALTISRDKVFRATPGRTMNPVSAPGLDDFKAELRSVVAGKATRDMRTRRIPGVGEVNVPAPREDARALRAFDPVPDLATAAGDGDAEPAADDPDTDDEQQFVGSVSE